jgi:guanylate kinase
MNGLAGKTLVMIVGPSSVGKSTVMDAACRLDPEFSYVKAFTTRPPRPGEKSHYRHVSRPEAELLHNQGQALTWVLHPTTGHIYGTTKDSFATEYNLLDTLSGSVGLYTGLPFAWTRTVSLTLDPEVWQAWLKQRYAAKETELKERLLEAKSSIEWSLAQPDMAWLVNREGEPDIAAGELIALARQTRPKADPAPPEAVKMLETLRVLLS